MALWEAETALRSVTALHPEAPCPNPTSSADAASLAPAPAPADLPGKAVAARRQARVSGLLAPRYSLLQLACIASAYAAARHRHPGLMSAVARAAVAKLESANAGMDALLWQRRQQQQQWQWLGQEQGQGQWQGQGWPQRQQWQQQGQWGQQQGRRQHWQGQQWEGRQQQEPQQRQGQQQRGPDVRLDSATPRTLSYLLVAFARLSFRHPPLFRCAAVWLRKHLLLGLWRSNHRVQVGGTTECTDLYVGGVEQPLGAGGCTGLCREYSRGRMGGVGGGGQAEAEGGGPVRGTAEAEGGGKVEVGAVQWAGAGCRH